MNADDQKNLLNSIGKFVRDEINKAVEPLHKRIVELENNGIQYVGMFQRAAEYRSGRCCHVRRCDVGRNLRDAAAGSAGQKCVLAIVREVQQQREARTCRRWMKRV